jgi:hypothetical protein
VVELIVAATVGFAVLIVMGVLLSVFSVVGWFLWLPFKIIGWGFKLLALLFAAPFILLAVLLGGFGVLLSAGVLLIPLFPLLLVGAVLWWIFKPRHASQARVVS